MDDRRGMPSARRFCHGLCDSYEVGRHVQELLGTSDEAMARQSLLAEKDFNKYPVLLKSQTDSFTSVWAHYAKRMNITEEGNLKEALTAAIAVGGENIQKQGRGYVVPHSFTSGTSEQRMAWFSKGSHSGDTDGGDLSKPRYNRRRIPIAQGTGTPG